MQEMMFLAVTIAVASLLWFAFKLPATPRFRSKPMLAGPYLEFFETLRSSLPDYHVFPQVALSALVDPIGGPKGRRFAVDCINGRRAGYAVFDQDMQLVAIVELSHRSRATRKEAALEACLAKAGIKTLRFYSTQMPSETAIRHAVEAQHSRIANRPTKHACIHIPIESGRRRQPAWPDTVNAR
ncbi:MAG TPA: DUF2726 domain-containing protein [Noviherbaspirillum sp.]|uniref:DUF2726 domain-containing protein n=1 Tax=Noviherbaspirillum sp. TaxID=1926288 RepID=UPI002DDD6F68|nr:DUF2726 domain-containing protein [Noviherbaspirillum sp.]HEV2610129.1 DUF2726 domain-containing protein [Noviherbaspirillum sp.]